MKYVIALVIAWSLCFTAIYLGTFSHYNKLDAITKKYQKTQWKLTKARYEIRSLKKDSKEVDRKFSILQEAYADLSKKSW